MASTPIYPCSFASDNHAGVCPEVMEAIASANQGDVSAYGADPWTEKFDACVKQHFGDRAIGYPVWNGTGANVLSLGTILKRHESVICAEKAHIAVDECGAPERHLGTKLVLLRTRDQKITPEQVKAELIRLGDQHFAQPRAVSITQTTEYGTAYTVAEIAALSKFCRENGLYLHVDGSRLANAAVGLGVSFRAMITDAGVDVLSLGATKNGAMGAEAVVILNPELQPDFLFARKQSMQLASKQRFLSAQLLALFERDLWSRNAAQANAMAKRLVEGVRSIAGIEITQTVQGNAVFARLAKKAVPKIQEKFPFYVWDECGDAADCEVRWMTHFRTSEKDVDGFIAAVKLALK